MAISTGAAILGGAAISGLMGSRAASSAADAQAQSARDANATQLQMFNQIRADMAPWRDAGQAALSQLVAGTGPNGQFMRDFGLSDFQADPGYQFRLSQGRNALENSAAARGGLLSGGTLKALTRFGQDYGSGEFGNAYTRWNSDRDRRFNRLSSLAGTGQTATQNTAMLGANAANQIGANQIGAGNARAAGQVGSANAWSNAAGNLQSMYMLNRMFPQAPAASPANVGMATWYD